MFLVCLRTSVFRVRISVLVTGQVFQHKDKCFSFRTGVFRVSLCVLVLEQVFKVIGQVFLVKDKCF